MSTVSPEKGKRGQGGGLCCLTYGDWRELEPFAAAWDDLAARAGAGISSSFAWRRVWWEFYGRGRLEVRLVWSGDYLVAVFPFFRETQRLGGLPVRLLRLVGCDDPGPCGGVLVEPGMEDAAVGVFADSLGGEESSNWDMVHLGLLPAYGGRVKELAEAFKRHFPDARVDYCENVSARVLIELPASYEEYLRGLSKQERYNIRRYDRRIRSRHDIEHVVRISADDFAKTLEKFLESHERFWRSRGKPGWFNEWPDAKAFHRRLAEVLVPRGECFITELAADGDVVAAEYCFRFGDLIHWLQPVRNDSECWRRYNLGRMALVKLFEYAVSTGVTLIDAGGSPHGYKLRLGGRLAGDALIIVTRRGLYSRCKVGLFRGASWLLYTLYQRIWYRRLAPVLGLGGRGFWRAWVRSRVAFPSRGAHVEPAERLQGKEESKS